MTARRYYYPAHPDGPWATPGLSITGVPGSLLRPIPGLDPGAPLAFQGSPVTLDGSRTFTWDLTGYQLPPLSEEEGTGYVVRAHLYVTLPVLLSLSHLDACPELATGRRAKARLGRLSMPPTLTWEGGPVQAVTFPAPVAVVAVRGEVRCYSPLPDHSIWSFPWVELIPNTVLDHVEASQGEAAVEQAPAW